MTSIRMSPEYEDHLYYPMVVSHRIVEMSGADIKYGIDNNPIIISKRMWDDVLFRLQYLEGRIND